MSHSSFWCSSPAQPSPAQHSPAQPSPAQPSRENACQMPCIDFQNRITVSTQLIIQTNSAYHPLPPYLRPSHPTPAPWQPLAAADHSTRVILTAPPKPPRPPPPTSASLKCLAATDDSLLLSNSYMPQLSLLLAQSSTSGEHHHDLDQWSVQAPGIDATL